MRIAFIHSCLEPGKDGVGDYTRLLAQECLNQGHPACLLSLNDPFVTGAPIESNDIVPMLRLGRHMPWPERIRKARAFLNVFQPDRISLQFVCYGWHPKGLAIGIGKRLQPLIDGTPLHLMLHELWIGEDRDAGVKEKIVGAVQRHFVLGMIRSLQPARVHTSNPAYVQLLARHRVTAQVLPLFGLIPIVNQPDSSWLEGELANLGLDTGPDWRERHWLLGLFGSLHTVWPPEPLFSYLQDAGQRHDRKIVILSIGRIGAGADLWQSLASKYSHQFTFCKLGEQSPEHVSQFLQFIDFGIATTPWTIIGKSATVSTMLDHGLPVIVNRDELRYGFDVPNEAASPLLCKMQPDLATTLPSLHGRPPHSTLPTIARQMLAEL